MRIRDIRLPVEVWDAIDGDTAGLVELLRSDVELSRHERTWLAMFFEGTLPKRERGRPPKEVSPMFLDFRTGQDLTTRIGWASYRFLKAKEYVRRRGWHLKSAPTRLHVDLAEFQRRVAGKFSIHEETFGNHVRRARQRQISKPTMKSMVEYWHEHRAKKAAEK